MVVVGWPGTHFGDSNTTSNITDLISLFLRVGQPTIDDVT